MNRFKFLLVVLLFASFTSSNGQQNSLNITNPMKEFILLIRLPLGYGSEEATQVRPEWTALTNDWKAQGIFITSYVFPSQSEIVSEKGTVKEELVSDGLRLISAIIIQVASYEEAVALAKKCPVLKQGGAVEVREIKK